MSPLYSFAVAALVLLAFVLVMLCRPLLRRGGDKKLDRQAINAAIYRDEQAELDKDRATGALSEADYQTAKEELARRVLEDVTQDPAEVQVAAKPGVPRTAWALIAALPLLSLPLYFAFGTPETLLPQASAPSADKKFSKQDIENMVSKLAARLQEDPNDPKGWLMLARSYKALGRLDDAHQAYSKIGPELGADSGVVLERVELEIYRTKGKVDADTVRMLNGVLKAEPNNPNALMMAGTVAYNRGQYKEAITRWEFLKKQLTPGSEEEKYVSEAIQAAKDKAK